MFRPQEGHGVRVTRQDTIVRSQDTNGSLDIAGSELLGNQLRTKIFIARFLGILVTCTGSFQRREGVGQEDFYLAFYRSGKRRLTLATPLRLLKAHRREAKQFSPII